MVLQLSFILFKIQFSRVFNIENC